MTYRSDINIDWNVEPRIITVGSPSTSIIVQDLYDTLRTLESSTGNIDNDFIVDAGGLEQLGGGVKVGLTVTLNDALLAFEARTGPSYTQCLVSGGNLVAVDASLNYYTSPISPTAFTQVILQTSSSATLQELESIQFSSFDGKVTIDTANGIAGTDFPIGTHQQPVNNLTDAKLIAEERGFDTIHFLTDLSINTGIDFQQFSFIGTGANKTNIYLDPAADIYACEFYDAWVTGTLDGNSIIERCVLTDLNYVSGFINECILNTGTISVAAGQTANIMSCYSGVSGTDTPTIDLGGNGNLGLRDYNGGIRLINMNDASANVSVDMNSGQVKLESSLTAGTVVLRGNGTLTYDLSGDASIINQLVNVDEVSNATVNKIVPFVFSK